VAALAGGPVSGASLSGGTADARIGLRGQTGGGSSLSGGSATAHLTPKMAPVSGASLSGGTADAHLTPKMEAVTGSSISGGGAAAYEGRPLLARWSGDGLPATPPTLTVTNSAGRYDSPWTSISNGTLMSIDAPADTTGAAGAGSAALRLPRLRLTGNTTGNQFLTWGSAVVGSQSVYAVRAYVVFDAIGTTGFGLITGVVGSTVVWRVDVGTTATTPQGQLRLRNVSTQVGNSAEGLSAGVLYRVEVVCDATATATVTAYLGDSMTVAAGPFSATITSGTGAATTAIDNVRFGQSFAGIFPNLYFDDLAVAVGATEIGPAAVPPSPAYTWQYWDGTTLTPLTVSGIWNGTTVTPGQPTYEVV
jgi:hypothetical protein